MVRTCVPCASSWLCWWISIIGLLSLLGLLYRSLLQSFLCVSCATCVRLASRFHVLHQPTFVLSGAHLCAFCLQLCWWVPIIGLLYWSLLVLLYISRLLSLFCAFGLQVCWWVSVIDLLYWSLLVLLYSSRLLSLFCAFGLQLCWWVCIIDLLYWSLLGLLYISRLLCLFCLRLASSCVGGFVS